MGHVAGVVCLLDSAGVEPLWPVVALDNPCTEVWMPGLLVGSRRSWGTVGMLVPVHGRRD
jgi:hypothetical protein